MAKFTPQLLEVKVKHNGESVGSPYVHVEATIDFQYLGNLDRFKNSDGKIDKEKVEAEFRKCFSKTMPPNFPND